MCAAAVKHETDAVAQRIGRVVVIGGGLSGLVAGWRLRERHPNAAVTVLEARDVAGGTAATSEEGGFWVDWGPSTFAPSAARLLGLVRDLGLEGALRAASGEARHRYVFGGGRLWQVPSDPAQWLRWPLLSWRERLRPLLEPFSAPPPQEDESVYAFAARRFGDGVAGALVEPMMLGITAGDAHSLSLRALAPGVHALDRDHRSLVWGMLQQRRAKARAGQRPPQGAEGGPSPSLWGLAGGVATLTQALAARLGDGLRLGAQVRSLEPREAGGAGGASWRVGGERGGEAFVEEADAVVVASPAHVAARLLEDVDARLGAALGAIPYASVRVVALGYRACDVPRALDGFGFLARRGEGVRSLGCLWSSSLFPEVAPRGHVLLRLIMGGPHDPDAVTLDDASALAAARADLRRCLGVEAAPVMVAQRVMPAVIPQYTLGHLARLAEIEGRARAWSGLSLCSSAYRGVGMEGCVSQAEAVAAAL